MAVAGAHVLLAPVWLLLWLLIPLLIWLEDRGPVFYRQKRVGYNGRVIEVWKFRTMIPDAERGTGPTWATAHDNRVTKVGKLLRRTALDELPQVINILRGDMSIVGPRSERPEFHERFIREVPGFEKRLGTRPGLTGLAQISGEYDLAPAEKLRFDLIYIQRMNPWLDVWIIVRSILNTVTGRWDRRAARNRVPRLDSAAPDPPDRGDRKADGDAPHESRLPKDD